MGKELWRPVLLPKLHHVELEIKNSATKPWLAHMYLRVSLSLGESTTEIILLHMSLTLVKDSVEQWVRWVQMSVLKGQRSEICLDVTIIQCWSPRLQLDKKKVFELLTGLWCVLWKEQTLAGRDKFQLVWVEEKFPPFNRWFSNWNEIKDSSFFYLILSSNFLSHSCFHQPHNFWLRNLPELVFYPQSLPAIFQSSTILQVCSHCPSK